MSRTMELRDRAVDLYNSGDIDAFVDIYTDDAVLIAPEGTFQGRAAIREYWGSSKASFPDGSLTVGMTVETGDTIAEEFTWTGTNTGPVPMPDGTELPPTGKRIVTRGMELEQVRDGKLAVHHLYWDSMQFATELGMVAGPSAT